MSRATAVERTLKTLRFFRNSPQGPEPDATGHHGLYYHFLDMRTGRRVWQCELSTVDSAFLLAGALTAGAYFDGKTAGEQEIRTLVDELYLRADWQWAQTMATPSHTAGNRKAVLSSTAGKVTTKRCCSTYWGLVHRPIHCPIAAMRRGFQLMNGNAVTALTIFTRQSQVLPFNKEKQSLPCLT